jgi:hypothetical protein
MAAQLLASRVVLSSTELVQLCPLGDGCEMLQTFLKLKYSCHPYKSVAVRRKMGGTKSRIVGLDHSLLERHGDKFTKLPF